MSVVYRVSKYIFRALVVTVLIVAALSAPGPALATNGSVVYTYDALGRVTTASYDTGIIIIYTYDANGNRLSQVINSNAKPLCLGSTAHGNPITFGTGLLSAYATGC